MQSVSLLREFLLWGYLLSFHTFLRGLKISETVPQGLCQCLVLPIFANSYLQSWNQQKHHREQEWLINICNVWSNSKLQTFLQDISKINSKKRCQTSWQNPKNVLEYLFIVWIKFIAVESQFWTTVIYVQCTSFGWIQIHVSV